MKRCSIFVISLIVLMGLASASFAIFPIPDSQITFKMQQGWYNDQFVWFIATDTNNYAFASSQGLTLAPQLSSAIGSGPAAIYIVRNPAGNQGPIFEAVPGALPYSGIWQVIYVDWQPGFSKVPITSAGQITTLVGLGEVTTTLVPIVIDAPIMALGQLGGPWYPGPAGTYRIPQGRVISNYTYTKLITLPTYSVFCTNAITRRVSTVSVIITDAETTALAALLGANYAPELFFIPYSDTMRFWVVLNSPQMCQLPVIEACASPYVSYIYSPIQRLTELNRISVSPSAVINNAPFISRLLLSGALTVNSEASRLNAPVVD